MAARVNTKLILILTVSLFGAGGVIGGLWFLQMRGDASRAARIGDEFFAQGDLEKAKDYYQRAVGRAPGNLEYLQKLPEKHALYFHIQQSHTFHPLSKQDLFLWQYQPNFAVLLLKIRYLWDSPDAKIKLLLFFELLPLELPEYSNAIHHSRLTAQTRAHRQAAKFVRRTTQTKERA